MDCKEILLAVGIIVGFIALSYSIKMFCKKCVVSMLKGDE